MSVQCAVRAQVYVWNSDPDDDWAGETITVYGYGRTSAEAVTDAQRNAIEDFGGADSLRAEVNDWQAA